jgi:hypothetical protein
MWWTSARAIDDAVTVGSTPGLIAGIFYVGGDIIAANAGLNGGQINNVPAGAGNSLNGVIGSGNQGIFAASQFLVTPTSGAPAPSGIFWSVTRQPNGAPQVPAQTNFGSSGSPLFQFTWTPTDFTPRTVNWNQGVPPALAALGGGAQYLVNVDPDPANSFLDAFLPTTVNYGSIPAVQVVPAPASLALLGLGGLAAARRRRA